MYLIARMTSEGTDYFGPFPTKDRAKQYAQSFEDNSEWVIEPLIVPNCVTVKLNY